MAPTFFATKEEFRKWLEENHAKEKEILAGFYKKGKQDFPDWKRSFMKASS